MSLKLNLSRCNIQIYNMLSVNVMSDEFIKKLLRLLYHLHYVSEIHIFADNKSMYRY